MKKALLFLLLALPLLTLAQVRQAATAVKQTFSVTCSFAGFTGPVQDSLFTGRISNWVDHTGQGLLPNALQAGYWLVDQSGRLYVIKQVISTNFSGAEVEVAERQDRNLPPSGQGTVFAATPNYGLIPPPPANQSGISDALRSKIDIHNALTIDQRTTAGGGISTVATDPTLRGDGSTNLPLKVDTTIIATKSDLRGLGGTAGAIIRDNTLLGSGTAGDTLRVDTSLLATKNDLTNPCALLITQANHNLQLFDVVSIQAQGVFRRSTAAQGFDGLVTNVIDADNFEITVCGITNQPGHPFVVANDYYLQVDGSLAETPDVNGYNTWILTALSAEALLVRDVRTFIPDNSGGGGPGGAIVTDNTLTGLGDAADPLKVDTAVIATKSDLDNVNSLYTGSGTLSTGKTIASVEKNANNTNSLYIGSFESTAEGFQWDNTMSGLYMDFASSGEVGIVNGGGLDGTSSAYGVLRIDENGGINGEGVDTDLNNYYLQALSSGFVISNYIKATNAEHAFLGNSKGGVNTFREGTSQNYSLYGTAGFVRHPNKGINDTYGTPTDDHYFVIQKQFGAGQLAINQGNGDLRTYLSIFMDSTNTWGDDIKFYDKYTIPNSVPTPGQTLVAGANGVLAWGTPASNSLYTGSGTLTTGKTIASVEKNANNTNSLYIGSFETTAEGFQWDNTMSGLYMDFASSGEVGIVNGGGLDGTSSAYGVLRIDENGGINGEGMDTDLNNYYLQAMSSGFVISNYIKATNAEHAFLGNSKGGVNTFREGTSQNYSLYGTAGFVRHPNKGINDTYGTPTDDHYFVIQKQFGAGQLAINQGNGDLRTYLSIFMDSTNTWGDDIKFYDKYTIPNSVPTPGQTLVAGANGALAWGTAAGNSIYTGSGTVPSNVVATITDSLEFIKGAASLLKLGPANPYGSDDGTQAVRFNGNYVVGGGQWFIGDLPNFPDLYLDASESGIYFAPDASGSVGMIMGDKANTYSYFNLSTDAFSLITQKDQQKSELSKSFSHSISFNPRTTASKSTNSINGLIGETRREDIISLTAGTELIVMKDVIAKDTTGGKVYYGTSLGRNPLVQNSGVTQLADYLTDQYTWAVYRRYTNDIDPQLEISLESPTADNIKFYDKYTFPNTDGTNGQTLVLDNNGHLQWKTLAMAPPANDNGIYSGSGALSGPTEVNLSGKDILFATSDLSSLTTGATITSGAFPGLTFTSVHSVAVSGQYLYAVVTPSATTSTIAVFDKTNPTAPTLLGTLAGGGSVIPKAYGMAVADNHLYYIQAQSLTVVDVSDPANMRQVATVPTDMAGQVFLTNSVGMIVEGSILYTVDGQGNQLTIWNISNPNSPTLLGKIGSRDGIQMGQPNTLYKKNNLLYVSSTGSYSVQAIDVSTPAAPADAGFFDYQLVDPNTNYIFNGIAIKGNTMYVGDYQWLHIIDVSTMRGASAIASLNTASLTTIETPYQLYLSIDEKTLIVADNTANAITLLDVTTPSTPSVTTKLNIPNLEGIAYANDDIVAFTSNSIVLTTHHSNVLHIGNDVSFYDKYAMPNSAPSTNDVLKGDANGKLIWTQETRDTTWLKNQIEQPSNTPFSVDIHRVSGTMDYRINYEPFVGAYDFHSFATQELTGYQHKASFGTARETVEQLVAAHGATGDEAFLRTFANINSGGLNEASIVSTSTTNTQRAEVRVASANSGSASVSLQAATATELTSLQLSPTDIRIRGLPDATAPTGILTIDASGNIAVGHSGKPVTRYIENTVDTDLTSAELLAAGHLFVIALADTDNNNITLPTPVAALNGTRVSIISDSTGANDNTAAAGADEIWNNGTLNNGVTIPNGETLSLICAPFTGGTYKWFVLRKR